MNNIQQIDMFIRGLSSYGDRRFSGNALSLLAEEVIAPEQFFNEAVEQRSPEKLLLKDLLIDAVLCYLPILHPRYEILLPSTRRTADEAKEWFFTDGVGQIPFQFVCEHLGKAPDHIRERLKLLSKKTNAYKSLFAFDYKMFSSEDVQNAICSYPPYNSCAGNEEMHSLYEQFFCYLLRWITKPMMTYLRIGRFFNHGNHYATKIHREFFLSYIMGNKLLLGIAKDFCAYFNARRERGDM